MNAGVAERLVRFQQPEKTLTYLGGLDDARIAALFGLDDSAYRDLVEGCEAAVREVAADMLADPAVAGQVDRLPFRPGQRVVAIGESTTADRLSWFEILRHLLALRRPADAVTLTNLAVTGCSTTQALTQLPALSYHRPDWVLCMLGGNDVQRLGPGDGTTLVSPSETRRNLVALRDLATRRVAARWVWLTPSAVDEDRVAAYPHFQRAHLSWANGDIDHIAEHLNAQPEPTVDTRAASAARADDSPHLDDGLHLTLAGQRAVAGAFLRTLAD
ncbi:SGNH/GDSL hydrolase family protein [Nonomuraea sp. SMC257]|uniref:SGNH/GDSL hydrolase family protein n=1 Tax=Nonomuraea montanisoli TaxID=2741721 RepID=A0A7Y6I8P1_9ACTN|nr:GDSL-type esterase/lipase family protein [Nonomuraea montanisoli]NUW33735.1 SGNH/GDSL hydrolase family protein [Nonomuraea montanisoli]